MGALIVIMLWLGINIVIQLLGEGKRSRQKRKCVKRRLKARLYNVMDDYDEYRFSKENGRKAA